VVFCITFHDTQPRTQGLRLRLFCCDATPCVFHAIENLCPRISRVLGLLCSLRQFARRATEMSTCRKGKKKKKKQRSPPRKMILFHVPCVTFHTLCKQAGQCLRPNPLHVTSQVTNRPMRPLRFVGRPEKRHQLNKTHPARPGRPHYNRVKFAPDPRKRHAANRPAA